MKARERQGSKSWKRSVVAALLSVLIGTGMAHAYDVYTASEASEWGGADDIYQCNPNSPTVMKLQQAVRDSIDMVYTNVAVLAAKGFIPYYDVPVAVATRYAHWLNPWYFNSGLGIQPLRPQSVLMDPYHRPIGMMFIEDIDTPADSPTRILYQVVDDGDRNVVLKTCSPWHEHADAFALSFFYYYRILWQGNTTPPSRTPQMVHVWYDNSRGVFAHDPPPEQPTPGAPPLMWKCTDLMRERGFPCSPGKP